MMDNWTRVGPLILNKFIILSSLGTLTCWNWDKILSQLSEVTYLTKVSYNLKRDLENKSGKLN